MKNYKFLLMSFAVAGIMFSCSDDDDSTNDDSSGNDGRSELYVTNGNNGNVTVYDMNNSASRSTLSTDSRSNEGVFYDGSSDELYVASRSENRLNFFTGVSDLLGGGMVDLEINSNTNGMLDSPRKIAVNGNILVVSDNSNIDGDENTAEGRFFIYNRTDNGVSLRNTITVNFAVWGITFNGNNLYAVVDKSSDLAIFNNLSGNFTTNGNVQPSKRITIEGINRTHGINYNSEEDLLLMTDIGDAGSDSDGAFQVITNANSKISGVSNGGMLSVSEQTRIAGDNTFMGNPVDIHYDEDSETIYVAEVANGGGRVLAFSENDYEAGGNISPSVNNQLSGANSLYFYDEEE